MRKGVIALVCFCIGFAMGMLTRGSLRYRTDSGQKIVVTDTLTMTIHDTITDYVPVLKTQKVIDTIRIHATDTIFISLPIEQKKYVGEKYEAYVSGYRPNLDSISVFNTETIKYITKTEIVSKKPKKLGIGLNAGYGIGKDGPTPYIGIGLSYNLIRL